MPDQKLDGLERGLPPVPQSQSPQLHVQEVPPPPAGAPISATGPKNVTAATSLKTKFGKALLRAWAPIDRRGWLMASIVIGSSMPIGLFFSGFAPPTWQGLAILAVWYTLSAVVYRLPWPWAKFVPGPITGGGNRPMHADNAVTHCILACAIAGVAFYFGWAPLLFDHLPGIVMVNQIFSVTLCLILALYGRNYGTRPDDGTKGKGFLYDFYLGCILHPAPLGIQLKILINSRFSMTFWMLYSASCVAASYRDYGMLDPGTFYCAVLQIIYLFKFFATETRSYRRGSLTDCLSD